jgi:two-component system cell cycle response regulator DivK
MPQRILVIEDDPKNMKLFRDVLSINGFETLEAGDGEAGVVLARSQSPDLIVTDVRLPGIGGVEVLRMLRETSATDAIPVIVVTAEAMAGDRERLLEAGFDDYISKPIDIRAFVERVEAHLAGRGGSPSSGDRREGG